MKTTPFLPTLPSLLAAPGIPLIHRDLSWLQFNDRVLSESRRENNPLLERAKFLAISASNLDEFFMIRFPSIQKEISSAEKKLGGDVTGEAERRRRLREVVLENVAKFGAKQQESLELLSVDLEAAGFWLPRATLEGHPLHAVGRKLFQERILPELPPAERFSLSRVAGVENLELVAVFTDLWIRVPKSLPTLYVVPVEERPGVQAVFFLDDLVESHLPSALGRRERPGLLRVTRDGDVEVELVQEDSESVPDVVRSTVKRRERGRPTRLQYSGEAKPDLLEACARTLRLDPTQVIPSHGSLVLSGLWQLLARLEAVPPLVHPTLRPLTPKSFLMPGLFEKLKTRDFLLHHPYDAFEAFIEWIRAAAADRAVGAISMTLYRTDARSPLVVALKEAAKAGKRVTVAIELRARFDELRNLGVAEELQAAGVRVVYGFGKLKLHAKIALVERDESDGKRGLYTHLSTGNYNAATSRQYTDLAILTSNEEIGRDAETFFAAISQKKIPSGFRRLVIAPTRLHHRLLQLIEAETQAAVGGSRDARIVAKVNALVDPMVIEKLYAASSAGVRVDLIVRGACSLIPGIPGLSERIRVVSIVDRFLEHSRLYFFGSSRRLYLSSADWMPRNFFSRLEIAFPVLDPRLFGYIENQLLPTYLGDTEKARELTPQGTWRMRPARFGARRVRAQFVFAEIAANAYRGTTLE